MLRLIIGSSNVAMAYNPEKFKEYPPYNMLKCTRFEVFKVMMDEIRNEKEIIIMVCSYKSLPVSPVGPISPRTPLSPVAPWYKMKSDYLQD